MADEELAKKEAEREREREREEGEDQREEESPPRRRSVSSESVSSISTSRSRRSHSGGDRSMTPPRKDVRRESHDSAAQAPKGGDNSPPRSRSPPNEDSITRSPYRGRRQDDRPKRRDRSRSGDIRRSRSPKLHPRDQRHGRARGHRDDGERPARRQGGPPRQRSLSPFSRRLAMTQSMNK